MIESNVKVAYHGEEFTATLSSWLSNRAERAAQELANDIRQTIGHQGREGYHSQPWEPPFRQSGALQNSVVVRKQKAGMLRGFLRAMSLAEKAYEVEVTDYKAPWLEFGIPAIGKGDVSDQWYRHPRPFMAAAVERAAARLQTTLRAGS